MKFDVVVRSVNDLLIDWLIDYLCLNIDILVGDEKRTSEAPVISVRSVKAFLESDLHWNQM